VLTSGVFDDSAGLCTVHLDLLLLMPSLQVQYVGVDMYLYVFLFVCECVFVRMERTCEFVLCVCERERE